jgi:hypothetical protein
MVGFVDVEGQGDKGVVYDTQLVSPLLCVSKAVLYNWIGRPAKDSILTKLRCLADAAKKISPAGLPDGQKLFGHLHLVLRDFCGNVDEVKAMIFDEIEGATPSRCTPEQHLRNETRQLICESFESVTVWGLPPPINDAQRLAEGNFTNGDACENYLIKVNALRTSVAGQLQEPKLFPDALSGEMIPQIVTELVAALNEGAEDILPMNIFKAAELRQQQKMKKEAAAIAAAARHCFYQMVTDSLDKSGDVNGDPPSDSGAGDGGESGGSSSDEEIDEAEAQQAAEALFSEQQELYFQEDQLVHLLRECIKEAVVYFHQAAESLHFTGARFAEVN